MTDEKRPNPNRAKDRGPLSGREGYAPRRHDHDRRNSTTQELTRTIDDLLDSLFGDVNHDIEALRFTGLIPRFTQALRDLCVPFTASIETGTTGVALVLTSATGDLRSADQLLCLLEDLALTRTCRNPRTTR